MNNTSSVALRPLDGSGSYIQEARSPITQFLLNVFGSWNEHKPQLFKDVPMTDMITPQLAYVTGNGSAEESMAGFAGPARIRGGVQFGKYGKNAINYGANQAKNYVAKEGQQFIRSQAENVVRNPNKPGTGIPFRGAEIQAPIVQGYTTKVVPEAMGGLKPGSVKPVIPWSTQARVAAIDAKNAVKGAAGKVATGAKTAAKATAGPLRNAAAYTGTGVGVGSAGYLLYNSYSDEPKDNKVAKPANKSVATKPSTPTSTTKKPVIPSFDIPMGRKIVKPITPVVKKPKKPTMLDEVVIRAAARPKQTTPVNTKYQEQGAVSDLQSAEQLAINAERDRLGRGSISSLTPLRAIIKNDNQKMVTNTIDERVLYDNTIRHISPIKGVIKTTNKPSLATK